MGSARLLLAFGAVLAAALLAILGAGGVQRAPDHVVADTRKVADAPAANEHDRVLLEVVTDAGDVRGDLDFRGQTDAGHLAKRRVGLLGRGRVHTDADPTTLRASPKSTGLRLVCRLGAALADQLLKGRHDRPFIENCALPRNSAREYEESSWSEAKAYQTLSSHVKPRFGPRRMSRDLSKPATAVPPARTPRSRCRRLHVPAPACYAVALQKTTRRRPFAEDRRCWDRPRSISCAGGQ